MNKEQHKEILNTPGFESLRKLLVKYFYYKMVKPGPDTMKQETIQIIQQLQKQGYKIQKKELSVFQASVSMSVEELNKPLFDK